MGNIPDSLLGGGNSNIFLFSSRKLGKMIQFDVHIFQMGGDKPPTRLECEVFFFVFFPGLDDFKKNSIWTCYKRRIFEGSPSRLIDELCTPLKTNICLGSTPHPVTVTNKGL